MSVYVYVCIICLLYYMYNEKCFWRWIGPIGAPVNMSSKKTKVAIKKKSTAVPTQVKSKKPIKGKKRVVLSESDSDDTSSSGSDDSSSSESEEEVEIVAPKKTKAQPVAPLTELPGPDHQLRIILAQASYSKEISESLKEISMTLKEVVHHLGRIAIDDNRSHVDQRSQDCQSHVECQPEDIPIEDVEEETMITSVAN